MPANYRWLHREPSPDEHERARLIAGQFALPLPLARLLVERGVADGPATERFLLPDLMKPGHLGDPMALPGARRAAELLWETVRAGGKVVVFGDYDVDGVVAAASLVKTLRRLGGVAEAFLPRRAGEGYGLTFAALERCLARHAATALLVTVDCGIRSTAEVRHLNQLGIKVVIIDHHEKGAELPEAAAIVNPRHESAAGAEHLCGAGVVFKVVHALAVIGRAQGWLEEGSMLARELLVPVGLATVADVVPLIDENRLLVHSALKGWGRHAGVGLKALLQRAAGRTIDRPDAYTFGFLLGPRINAAGRMDDAMVAYELLLTEDPSRAADLAARLEHFNGERRGVEERVALAARRQCGLDAPGAPFSGAAVVAHGLERDEAGAQGWHPGVLGIVAARLCESAGVPAAVISVDERGIGRGSARAGGDYHVLEAVAAAAETLAAFGGHAGAAGFTIKAGELERFGRLFKEACDSQARAGACGRRLELDGWLEPSELTLEFYQEIQRLAPFGHGNRTPRWGLRGVTLKNVMPMGSAGAHMQCSMSLRGRTLPRAVWFRKGHQVERLRTFRGALDIAFELRENCYGGESKPELLVLDMRASEGAPHPAPEHKPSD